MNVIDYLLKSDPAIVRLTRKYLLNEKVHHTDEGYIKKYLDLYLENQKMWGPGVYGPKWVSTHYTMMELRYMEIDPNHKIYQEALNTLIDHEWNTGGIYREHGRIDLCIVGMLLSLLTYGRKEDERIHEMIDYVLDHIMPDGAWNCRWNSKPTPLISSVHTTINVLEGLKDYDHDGYTYRIKEVRIAMLQGVETLLRRNLYQAHHTKEPIHPDMTKSTYPPRWKYDILRALEFLESVNYPDNLRLTDSINLLIHQLKGPFMPKGTTLSGRIHFKLENGRYGMFNTLRALKVLKMYRFPLYEQLIHMEI